jgi:hypothetical protein
MSNLPAESIPSVITGRTGSAFNVAVLAPEL